MIRICLGTASYVVEFVSPEAVEGLCGKHYDPVDGFGGRIEINRNLTGHLLLDTMLHEALHGLCPYLDEEEVKKLGTCLTSVLLTSGFVKEEDLCPEKIQARVTHLS